MKHTINNDLPENFYLSLTEFLLHAKQQVIAVSQEYGLTSIQALTLMITTGEERPMKSLCQMYDCDAGNITGIIDGLEKKNLVSRQPHPKDKRIKVIHLEPAGIKLQKQLAKSLVARSDSLFSGLNATEIKQLVGLIQKITAASTLPH